MPDVAAFTMKNGTFACVDTLATAIAFVRTGGGVTTDVVSLGVLDPAEQIVTALPEAYGVR